MDRRDQSVGVVLILLSAFGFGSLPTLASLAYDAGLNVSTALSIRFTLAALLLWAMSLLRSQRIARRQLGGLVLVGLAYTTNSAAFFLAVRYAPATTVSMIFYTYPAVVALLSILFLGERFTPLRALSLCLAIFGCLLTLELRLTGLSGTGVFFALCSAVFCATYIVLSSRFARGIPVSASSGTIMAGAAVSLLLYSLVSRSLDFDFAPRGWLILLGLVILASVLALQLFLAGILRLGPSTAAIVGTFEPVVAVGMASVVLNEPIGFYQLAGGLLILIAILLLRLPAHPRARAVQR